MTNYSFWKGDLFVGVMALSGDHVAELVADRCGATMYNNEETKAERKKCAGCGGWNDSERLVEGVCGCCGYAQRIKDFISHMKKQLDKNREDREELYKEDFTLTYRGESVTLIFGATEYDSILHCLENILDENMS